MNSLINKNRLVTPIEWIEELQRDKRTYSEIVDVIEIYEFIIACLILAISFLTIDKSLLKIAEEIYNRNRTIFIQKYFTHQLIYGQFLNILQFFEAKNEYFKIGLCETVDRTKMFYDSWNLYYEFIFGKSDTYFNLKNEIKQTYKDINGINIQKFINNVRIPNIDYIGIKNSLEFFNRKKPYLKKKDLFLKSRNNIEKKDSKEHDKENQDTGLIRNFLAFLMGFITFSTKKTMEIITNRTDNIEELIIEQSDRVINELKISMEISNEILEAVHNDKSLLDYECAEKIWMFARHPEFKKPLQALIDKGFVESCSYHYIWKEDNKRNGFGINILGYFILQNVNLKKWADSSKSKIRNEDTGIFTKRVWEPFNVGFKQIDLENNVRNSDKPRNYDKFLEQLTTDSKLDITLK